MCIVYNIRQLSHLVTNNSHKRGNTCFRIKAVFLYREFNQNKHPTIKSDRNVCMCVYIWYNFYTKIMNERIQQKLLALSHLSWHPRIIDINDGLKSIICGLYWRQGKPSIEMWYCIFICPSRIHLLCDRNVCIRSNTIEKTSEII